MICVFWKKDATFLSYSRALLVLVSERTEATALVQRIKLQNYLIIVETIPLINPLLTSNPWNNKMKQQPVTSETCSCFFGWVLSFDLWCLSRYKEKSLSTALLTCVWQIKFCTKQFNPVLLNNIQDMKKSLWWQMLTLKYISKKYLPLFLVLQMVSSSISSCCKNCPCRIALRADWKLTETTVRA